jgi:hypothetical protein
LRYIASTSDEYYEDIKEAVVRLPSLGLMENIHDDNEGGIIIGDEGIYEIRYTLKVQEAERPSTMSVRVTRNGQGFENDKPPRQIVGQTDSQGLPLPTVFDGLLVERLHGGDVLRMEHDAPCVIFLQQGRGASLFVRRLDNGR